MQRSRAGGSVIGRDTRGLDSCRLGRLPGDGRDTEAEDLY